MEWKFHSAGVGKSYLPTPWDFISFSFTLILVHFILIPDFHSQPRFKRPHTLCWFHLHKHGVKLRAILYWYTFLTSFPASHNLNFQATIRKVMYAKDPLKPIWSILKDKMKYQWYINWRYTFFNSVLHENVNPQAFRKIIRTNLISLLAFFQISQSIRATLFTVFLIIYMFRDYVLLVCGIWIFWTLHFG